MAFLLDTTFWITALNIVLALATLGLLALVAGAVLQDLYLRAISDRRTRQRDANMLRHMGITMHDGGRRIDEIEELQREKKQGSDMPDP